MLGYTRNIKDVVIYGVIIANVSNSCFMSTNGIYESKRPPWINTYALDRLTQSGKLIVLINDFLDGETAETATGLSQRRLTGNK